MAKPGVTHLLAPPSVTIIGASSRKGAWAHGIFQNLKRFGFAGPVHLVNPNHAELWDGEPSLPGAAALRDDLIAAIQSTGMAVSGPNCMGHIVAKSRLVTISEDRIREVKPGPVAVVGQSGGIVMALNRSLADRGVGVGHAITSGNELGLTTADDLDHFAADAETRVVASRASAS